MSKEKKVKEGRENWQISRKEMRAYLAGRVGIYGEQALIPGLMNTFLLFNGISLTSVAFFTLVVKVIDAMDDLLFGFLIDKIDIKKNRVLKKLGGEGRYMPWIRCFIWIFPIVVILFFLMPSGLGETAKLVWFAVTYLLFDFTYTIVDVPTQSLTMTITDVPEERNHILTIGMVIIMAIMYAMTIIQTLLISEDVGMPISAVGVLFAIIYLVPMIPFSFKVKEHNSEMKNVDEAELTGQESYTLKEMFKAIIHNKPYMVLEISGLIRTLAATGTAVGLFVSFYLYGSSTAMVVPGLVGMLLGIVIQLLAPKICKKCGNKNVAVVCSMACGVLGLIVYLLGWKNFGLVVIYTVITTVIASLLTLASTYMMLQTIDYGKYINRRDTTGIFNSINTFISKVAPSIASSLGLVILAVFGWVNVNAESFADLAVQNVQQPASAYQGLWILTILIPAIGCLISSLTLIFFYHLTDADAALMSKCVAGEISREECKAGLSRR